MPPKGTRRRYNNKARSVAKKYGTSLKNVQSSARTIQAAVRRVLAQNVETKKSNTTFTDNTDISHNNFVICDSNVLFTTQGITDPNTISTANRIGDEINLKGVAFKFMLENNHRYSDTTFRIMLIKSAKGDPPTPATLFNGLSGNKMMDTINNERYTVMHTKYVTVKQGTPGGDGVLGTTYVGSGLFDGDASLTQSASKKIVKFYIPGYKFGRKGLIRYENGTSQVKFFDYTVVVYAYGVGSTSEALGWLVGRINEYIKIMYYKDA